jgi:predicted transcriptional regulator
MTDQTIPPMPHLTVVPPAPGTSTAPPIASITTFAEFSAAMKKINAKSRWSSNVMDRGYTIIPTILLWGQGRLDLTPDELNVLLQIISHWFYKGNDPHPSKATIATRMDRDPRTVQRHLTSLENKGFIKRIERFKPSKGQDSNAYELSGLAAKLESIAGDFAKVSEMNKKRRRKVEAPAAS